ncbi:MAG TPA: hypothetical protein VFV34_04530 [Blastocatellia bacterium]|nr:hypothetical protein [Blastocatellia bacterium]
MIVEPVSAIGWSRPGSAAIASDQTLGSNWQPVVYAVRDPATGMCSLKARSHLLKRFGKPRQFVFGSMWHYEVTAERWVKTDLSVERAITLSPTEVRSSSAGTDQELVRLTDKIGLYWAEWKEDDRVVDALVFSGPILCEDIMIGEPPKGMIATCVQSSDSATAMFVPDPKVYCRR